MKLYAELPLHRTRQVLADLFVVAWTALWIWIGRTLYDLVAKLAVPGLRVEEAGSDLAGAAGRGAERVQDTPLIGNFLKAPFDALVRSGESLQQVGQTHQDAVYSLALWMGILAAALPVLFVLYLWFARRGAWVRRASAAHLIRGDSGSLQLFALRALANQPLIDLRRVAGDPMGAYNDGNYAPLAALELSRLGLAARLLPNQPGQAGGRGPAVGI